MFVLALLSLAPNLTVHMYVPTLSPPDVSMKPSQKDWTGLCAQQIGLDQHTVVLVLVPHHFRDFYTFTNIKNCLQILNTYNFMDFLHDNDHT